MRATYRVLAYLVALEVVVQAAAIAYAMFGESAYIEGGGVIDQAGIESGATSFSGVGGFILHGVNGQIVVPLLALALLVVSFFTRLPRGVAWAGAVFGAVVVQVLLGLFSHSVPALGALHGAVALVVLGLAVAAARAATGAMNPAAAPAGDHARVS